VAGSRFGRGTVCGNVTPVGEPPLRPHLVPPPTRSLVLFLKAFVKSLHWSMTLSLRIVWKIALLKSGKNVGSNAENQESVSFAIKVLVQIFCSVPKANCCHLAIVFWWNYKEQLPSNCISAQLSQMLSFALPLMMTMRILLLWVGQILEWVLMPK